MQRRMLIAAAAALMSASSVLAETAAHDHGGQHGAAPVTTLTEGEVRRVDKAAQKITIKHGAIVSMDMPAMTMVYAVADPAMLDRVKPGDRILFAAEKTGDTIMVTRIEPRR